MKKPILFTVYAIANFFVGIMIYAIGAKGCGGSAFPPVKNPAVCGTQYVSATNDWAYVFIITLLISLFLGIYAFTRFHNKWLRWGALAFPIFVDVAALLYFVM